MNILSITSILPIPDFVRNNNDFVFQTYNHYRKIFPQDNIVIIKPVRYDLNLITNLRKKTIHHRLKEKFRGEAYGFKILVLPFYSTWGYRNIHALITRTIYSLNIRKINSLLDHNRFDVIHAQYIFPDGLLAYILAKKLGVPYLVTTHNERFYFDHIISRKIALRIVNHASRVLPINYSNYQYLKSQGLENICFMPLGFNKDFVRSAKPSTTGRVSILTIAELIRLKNIDKVLRAIKPLVGTYDLHYTIIGSGPEKVRLAELTESLNLREYVDFIEHVPHELIADEMYKHDIFIMPSYFETFGRVYFEVMAMGIPAICARGSGIYGIFKDMEEGISVDHKDITSITHALEFLIKNPDERMKIGEKGKRLVERYTWENIASDLHNKYLEALAAK